MKLTWLSHASWMIEINHHRVLLDPFFTAITTLPGIGPKTEEVLTGEHGLKFVRDIVASSESRLKAIFGGSWSA